MATFQFTMFQSYFLFILMFLFTVCYSIPLDQFFPFRDSVKDTELRGIDDGSTALPLNFGFTFYNETYQTIHVSVSICIIHNFIILILYAYIKVL